MKVPKLLLLLLVGCAAALAAGQQGTTTPVQEAPTVIGPDDTVVIVALNADEISKPWRISSTGELNLPMLGRVHAAGMTVDQLEHELTTRLGRYVRNPQVTVYISEFRSQRITVSGAVEKPGSAQLEGHKTLLEVLMMAGGPKAAGPTVTVTRNLRHGTIPLPEAKTEGGFSVAQLPLKQVLQADSSAANLEVDPEDVVSVSREQRLVFVMGEVNRPGAVELVTQDSLSIVQLLAAAGGLTKTASPGKTKIMRIRGDGLYEPVGSVNLKRIMSGRVADIRLSPGDVVLVPSNQIKGFVQTAMTSVATTGGYIIMRY